MRAATSGGSVTVKQGTYYEYINFNGKSITITSADPEDPNVVAATIIDGNDSGPIITFQSSEDANSVLTGFTITDGNSTNGGGIYCLGANPTISYCIIKDNLNCDMDGGGMYNSWADSNGSSPTLYKCSFINNTAASRGGAIGNYESSPTLRDCSFIDNTALNGGGAIVNWSNSDVTMINCVFISNSGTDEFADGGAIYSAQSHPKIFNCGFYGNWAEYRGGAMYNFFAKSTLTITNSTFSGNSANGTGIAVGGGAIANLYSDLTITNCTFTTNDANDEGGGIFNWDNCNVTITNCILWGNTASNNPQIYKDGTCSVTVNYCDVEGGYSGTKNINSDPNFARDPNDGGDGWGTGGNDDYGDLHLTPGSLCIDAGDNNAVPADTVDLDGDSNTAEPIPWDFDGHPRFVDDPCTTDTGSGTPPIVDMGADEFPYLGDLNFSGCVNFEDFAIFAPRWRDTGCGTCGGADLTGDANVDYDDLRQLALNWLAGCEP
jgi:predicted outer membrane repeat protein